MVGDAFQFIAADAIDERAPPLGRFTSDDMDILNSADCAVILSFPRKGRWLEGAVNVDGIRSVEIWARPPKAATGALAMKARSSAASFVIYRDDEETAVTNPRNQTDCRR